jgi:signal transduction histidine kinase
MPKILIVEDEAIVAEDIATSLEKLGYTIVDIISSGHDAIAAATQLQPDLVLMDIMLQGDMDGIQAAQYIHDQLQIPIVYLTANADDTTFERANQTSPFGYILKPFKDKELRAAIEIALSKHQLEMKNLKALAIAEQERLQAEQQSEIKSHYLSMASHEFRTPLSVIRMATELLQHYNDQMSEAKRQQNLQRIQTASESMNALLEDVLIFGRIESGKLELQSDVFDVVDFCRELLETLKLTDKQVCQLELVSLEPAIWVCLDKQLLWHILNNLLSNAIKYSPHGGKVSLFLMNRGNELSLRVKDQGIGIPPASLPHLFEPFCRGSNVGKIPGTGLGLAIAKYSVQLLNGEIEVESQINQGTTFTVKLPLKLQQ